MAVCYLTSPLPQLRVDVLVADAPSTPPAAEAASSPLATPLENPAPYASSLIQVRAYPSGTPFSPSPPNPLLEYPIKLIPQTRKTFFVEREGFDVVSMFKNPMMLMMLFAAGMIFILPKAMVHHFLSASRHSF